MHLEYHLHLHLHQTLVLIPGNKLAPFIVLQVNNLCILLPMCSELFSKVRIFL